MKFVFTGLCMLLTAFVFSQSAATVLVDSLKARYNNETLHFFKGYLSKGENGGHIGYADLKNEFGMSPDGSKEYALSQKNRTTATVLLSCSLACACILTVHLIDGSFNGIDRGLLIGWAGLGIVSIPFSIRSNKKLQHAIWLRNRDVVFHQIIFRYDVNHN